MSCIGHIFDEQPLPVVVPCLTPKGLGQYDGGWYTCPPRGSKVVSQSGDAIEAVAPDLFIWIRERESPGWIPNGSWYGCPSIEDSRNFRMRLEDESE